MNTLKNLWSRYFAGVRFIELLAICALSFILIFRQTVGSHQDRLVVTSLWTGFIGWVYLREPKSGDYLLTTALTMINPVLGQIIAKALGASGESVVSHARVVTSTDVVSTSVAVGEKHD